jgi:hypothetical protein
MLKRSLFGFTAFAAAGLASMIGITPARANLVLTAGPGGGNGSTDNVIFNACSGAS